jgi:O-antigen/teichoic acid export membrane protein
MNLSSFGRSGVVRASGLRVAALIIGVLASVALARLGGTEVKGIASSFAAATALAYIVIAFDMPQQVLRQARESRVLSEASNQIARSWAAYGCVCSVAAVTVWAVTGSNQLWLAVGTLGFLTSAQLGVVANGLCGPTSAAIGAIVQQSTMLLLAAGFYSFDTLDVSTARGVVLGSYFAALAYYWIAIRRNQGQVLTSRRFHPLEFLAYAKRGLSWQPARVAQLALLRLDTIAVLLLIDAAAAGIYSVGVSTASLAGVVPAQFAARATHNSVVRENVRTGADIQGALSSGVAASVALASIGWLLIPGMYGADFAPGYQVQLLIAPGVVAYGALQVLTNQVRLTGRPRQIGVPSIFGAAVMISLLIPFTQAWGMLGTAAASSAGSCAALGVVCLARLRATQ